MEYIKIAALADFNHVRLRSYRLMGRKIAVFRQEDGTFLAVEAGCKHQGADLTAGELQGTVIVCPRHKWKYDLVTGECLNHDSLPLRRYGIKIEDEHIWVTPFPREE